MQNKINKEINSQQKPTSVPIREELRRNYPKYAKTGLPPLGSPNISINTKLANTCSSNLKKTKSHIQIQQPITNNSKSDKIIDENHYQGRRASAIKINPQILKTTQKGYVLRLKQKITPDKNFEDSVLAVQKFENPVLTLHRRQLKQIKEIKEDESVIKEDDLNNTNYQDKSIIIGCSKNRLTEMKNASSHSSSNSQQNLNFQLSSSEKLSQADGSAKLKSNKQAINECEEQQQQQQQQQQLSVEEQNNEFQREWMRKEWIQGDFLGAGSFGQVFQAMDCGTGQIFALKKIDLRINFDQQEDLESLQKELMLMRRLQHPHIITYMGHQYEGKDIYIYLEYMSQGSLNSIINRFGPLKEQTIRIYSKQVLEALKYLHENRVCHRDIKGANILVDSNGIVKVADFGCSSQMEKTMTLFRSQSKNGIISLKGSIPWMPPEVITQTNYGTSADIWSFGCTVLEMATGTVPWSECDFDNPIAAIMKIGLQEEIPQIPSYLGEQLQDFIRLCLQRDPLKRPKASQLLNHCFFTSDI